MAGFDLSALTGGGADSIDPAMLQMKPRMELARALTTAGMDTSAAHPMQALARAVQGGVGGYLQSNATSDLAKLYAQQAGGMAGALEQASPGHPLVAALRSGDPMTQAMALRQAGPALMKLPEEAESKRRFGIESGMTREGLDLRRELADRPEFKSDVGFDPRDGRKQSGWVNPKTQTITPYRPGGPAGADTTKPVVVTPDQLLNWQGSGKPAPFGILFIKKDDPDQIPHIWQGG